MRVRITNFQPFSAIDFVVEGLTVLVGRSNVGKSAIIRALQGAFFNRAGNHFVRLGETNAEVTVSGAPTAAGGTIDVQWTKGKTANAYRVDGAAYAKVGTSTPPPIQDAGYRDVWVGDAEKKRGGELRPQVSSQFDPLFLLTETGGFISDALTAASRLSVIQTAAGRSAGDLKAVRMEVTRLSASVEAERAALALLEPVELVQQQLMVLRERLVKTTQQAAAVSRARTLAGQIQRLRQAPTQVPEASYPSIDAPYQHWRERAVAVATWRRLAPAAGVARPVPPSEVSTLLSRFDGYSRLARVAQERSRLAGGPGDVPSVPVWPAGLSGSLRLIEDVRQMAARLDRTVGLLHSSQAAAHSMAQEVEEAEAAVTQALSELSVCPTCGRAMENP